MGHFEVLYFTMQTGLSRNKSMKKDSLRDNLRLFLIFDFFYGNSAISIDYAQP
jgi:hypothetical protein